MTDQDLTEREKTLRTRYRRDNDLNYRPAVVTTKNGSIYDPDFPGKIWIAEQTPIGLSAPRSVFPPTQQGIQLKPGNNVRLGTNLKGQDYIVEYDTISILSKGQNPVPQNPPPQAAQTAIQTLAVIPQNPPSLTLVIRAWNPVVGNIPYRFAGTTVDLTSYVPSAGQMCYAAIFIKADFATLEVKTSTARSQADVPLGLSDEIECLNAKTLGSTVIWVQKLIGGQTTIAQADLDADGIPRQQLVNTDDDTYIATVSTTDATVTTLWTLTIPASTTVAIRGRILARRTGGGAGSAEDGAMYERSAAIKNVGGTATLIGSVASIATMEDQAGWDATFDVTGATVRCRITGAASNNVDWRGRFEVEQVS